MAAPFIFRTMPRGIDEPNQRHILDCGLRHLGWLNALCMVVFFMAATAIEGAEAGRARRVLMISAQNQFAPATLMLERSVQGVLQGRVPGRVELYGEYLDDSRFPGETNHRRFREYLREKYALRPPDVLLVFYSGNFELVEAFARDLFPNLPLVAVGTVGEEEVPRERLGANVTGVVARADISGTMKLIMKAQPETRRIVVIAGSSATDRIYLSRAEKAAQSLAGKVEFEFWTNRTMAELRQMVGSMPPRTAILMTTVFRDSAGEMFVSTQVAGLIATSANVPVYNLFDIGIGRGVIGGSVVSIEALGKRAGELAKSILNGAAPASLPFEIRTQGVPMFDWRALQRWGISERRLPPGSLVQFRMPSIWEQYRWYVIAAVAITAAQTVLIAGFVVQLARHRRAEVTAHRLQRELSHVNRISTVAQLTTTLAHELNQPLGAILSNAEAAELILQGEPPCWEELRAILADIRRDDQRASDVIQRLRALLQRRELELSNLAIDELIGDVVNLVKNPALAHQIAIETRVEPGLPTVRGDRVHLQQVLLNLLFNAMDSLNDCPAAQRRIEVKARLSEDSAVEVAVTDYGHGISPDNMAQLFEPFYTTKPDGMGMGLPISRTIVEAHGGRIWAENNPERGATFRFTLPISDEGRVARDN